MVRKVWEEQEKATQPAQGAHGGSRFQTCNHKSEKLEKGNVFTSRLADNIVLLRFPEKQTGQTKDRPELREAPVRSRSFTLLSLEQRVKKSLLGGCAASACSPRASIKKKGKASGAVATSLLL